VVFCCITLYLLWDLSPFRQSQSIGVNPTQSSSKREFVSVRSVRSRAHNLISHTVAKSLHLEGIYNFDLIYKTVLWKFTLASLDSMRDSISMAYSNHLMHSRAHVPFDRLVMYCIFLFLFYSARNRRHEVTLCCCVPDLLV
jgi:hypothetical protein